MSSFKDDIRQALEAWAAEWRSERESTLAPHFRVWGLGSQLRRKDCRDGTLTTNFAASGEFVPFSSSPSFLFLWPYATIGVFFAILLDFLLGEAVMVRVFFLCREGV